MATHPDYPGASSRLDKGKTVWRYKQPRSRKEVRLKGVPGTEEFELSYAEASRTKCAAEILNLPGRALPYTFGKAARMLENTSWWIAYDEKTQTYNAGYIERFLEMQVDPTAPLKWKDVPVKAMTRPYLNDIAMSIYRSTPHAGRHFMTAYRKLTKLAIEQKWIEPEEDVSITIKLKKVPHVGRKMWDEPAMAKYEKKHAIGTPARTCYELVKWLGNRRSDVATLRWDSYRELEIENEDGDIEYVPAFDFNQQKNKKKTGGAHVILPFTDKLLTALKGINCREGTVLQRFDGEPYSIKSLTGQMAVWTKQAGLPAGFTMHGLRRNFARSLLKSKVNIIAIRDMMGHDDVATTQIYLQDITLEDSALEAVTLVNTREAKRDAAQRRSLLKVVS